MWFIIILTAVSKRKDFSRSQTVMYAIFRFIETLLLLSTNLNSAVSDDLNAFHGHSPSICNSFQMRFFIVVVQRLRRFQPIVRRRQLSLLSISLAMILSGKLAINSALTITPTVFIELPPHRLDKYLTFLIHSDHRPVFCATMYECMS